MIDYGQVQLTINIAEREAPTYPHYAATHLRVAVAELAEEIDRLEALQEVIDGERSARALMEQGLAP